MLKLSSRSLTLFAAAIVLAQVVAVAPTASAAVPQKIFEAPYSVKNDITAFDLDAQGRYAAVVVNINPTAVTPLGAVSDEYDVYLFDLTSTGLMWRTHHEVGARTGQVPTQQAVAFAASTGQTVSDPGVFYVGGPGNLVSGWNTNGPASKFDRQIGDSGHVSVVGASANGQRVAFGLNTQTVGRLYMMDGAGKYLWDLNITDSFGNPSRVTAIEFARNTNLLVVGHEKGLYFLDANANTKPQNPTKFRTDGKVTDLDVSRDGNYVVVGTDNGASSGYVYYFPMQTSRDSPFNRGFSSPVRAVAMSLDGRYFAAGTGAGDVHFFERGADASVLAQFREDPQTKATRFNLGSNKPILSLDYDSTGSTLVATTDLEVAGFHTSTHTPIWRATATAIGLDTPLRGAKIGDAGERIFVAGKTLVTGLRNVLDAKVALPGGLRASAVPGDTVRFDVTVTNTGSAPDTYTFKVQTPAGGWTSDPVKPLTLLPEQSATVKLNLTSPTGAPPGFALTKLSVESNGRKENPRFGVNPVVGAFDLNITLTRVNNVRIEASERSLTLNQGQDTTFPFTVRNLGNAPAQVNLSALQSPSRGSSWGVRFDPEQVTVQPGAQETVTAIITAPQDASDGDSNTITIRGRVGTAYHSDFVLVGRVNPVYQMELTASTTNVVTKPGNQSTVRLTLRNTGNTMDTVNLTALVLPEAARLDWRVTVDYPTLDVARGSSRTATLSIRSLVREPEAASVTVTMTTLFGNEQQAVTIELSQDNSAAAEVGFFERLVPAPDILLMLAAFVVGAALLAVRRRETR